MSAIDLGIIVFDPVALQMMAARLQAWMDYLITARKAGRDGPSERRHPIRQFAGRTGDVYSRIAIWEKSRAAIITFRLADVFGRKLRHPRAFRTIGFFDVLFHAMPSGPVVIDRAISINSSSVYSYSRSIFLLLFFMMSYAIR